MPSFSDKGRNTCPVIAWSMFCQCFYLGPLEFWSCFLLKEIETLFLKDLVSLNSGQMLWLQREKQRSLLQAHLVPGVNLIHCFDSQDLLSLNDWSKQQLAGTEPQHVPHQQCLKGQGSFPTSRKQLWNQSLSRQDSLLFPNSKQQQMNNWLVSH